VMRRHDQSAQLQQIIYAYANNCSSSLGVVGKLGGGGRIDVFAPQLLR
jgi:hypothetical protein